MSTSLSGATNTSMGFNEIGGDWVGVAFQSASDSSKSVTSSLAQEALTQPRSEPKPLTDRVISWIRNIPSKINNFFSALFSKKAPEVVKAPEVQLTPERNDSIQWLNGNIECGIRLIVARSSMEGEAEQLVKDGAMAECHKGCFQQKLTSKLTLKLNQMHSACKEELKHFILKPKPINDLSDDAKFLLTIMWVDCAKGSTEKLIEHLSHLMGVDDVDLGREMLRQHTDAKIVKFNNLREDAKKEVLKDFAKEDKAAVDRYKRQNAPVHQSSASSRSYQKSRYKTYLGCNGDNCA